MNFADWYTDTASVYRVTEALEGALTRHTRQMVYQDIPCRIYADGGSTPRMAQDSASVQQTNKIALSNDYDIHAGDELIITRGGGLGHTGNTTRAFAGDPHHHYEPFGAVMPQLAHQEISLLQEERI